MRWPWCSRAVRDSENARQEERIAFLTQRLADEHETRVYWQRRAELYWDRAVARGGDVTEPVMRHATDPVPLTSPHVLDPFAGYNMTSIPPDL